jgi:hypothetical protein
VTVEPETVAGPEVTAYVTAPVEADVALTVKGETPAVTFAMGVKLSIGVAGLTTIGTVTVAAEKSVVSVGVKVTESV